MILSASLKSSKCSSGRLSSQHVVLDTEDMVAEADVDEVTAMVSFAHSTGVAP